MRNPICLLTLGLFQASSFILFTAPRTAYATRPDNLAQTEIRGSQLKASKVRIQGLLICDAGSQNTGNPCDLRLQEAGTGRIIRLIEADEAMQLFQSGARNVAIEGTMPDRYTLAVSSARSL